MSGRVLHFGPYEGEEIDDIVEMDPAYILEISATYPDTGISQTAISRARQLLDEPAPWLDDDDLDDEIQSFGFGQTRFDYD